MKDKVERKCWKLWESLLKVGGWEGEEKQHQRQQFSHFPLKLNWHFSLKHALVPIIIIKRWMGNEKCVCVCWDIQKREGENMKEDKENIISWWQRAVRVEVGGCREKYGIFIKVKQIIVRTIIEFHTCCCTKCLPHPDLQCSLEWKLVVKTQNHKRALCRGKGLYGEWGNEP